MSQKKNEAYKEAKKNKAVNEKKAKRKKILGWTFGILCALLVIGASAFLVYYTDVMLPKKQAEEAAATLDNDTIIETEDNEGIEGAPLDSATTDDTDTETNATDDTDTETNAADDTEAE